jgi:probable rRNA maturation factor
MAIQVHWESAERPLEDAAVCEAAEAALRHGGREGANLSVVLIDEEEMIRIHGEFLGDPTPTDVVTFDLRSAEDAEEGFGGPGEQPEELAQLLADAPVGELYVSVEMAQCVASERGVSAARELALYVVHGVLHLCNFDDRSPTDRKRIRIAEKVVLESLGYPKDDAPHERD